MTLQQVSKDIEMDKKRWFVRYLILAAVGLILGIKVYLLLFVVDIVVGIYSFVTSFVLFSILLFSYLKYKDPYFDAEGLVSPADRPFVSIIVPVKNEEGNIRNCVQSCIDSSYPNKEIIIINDGSTDKTTEILDEMRKSSDIRVIHFSKSVGKKKAVTAGTEVAKGEYYVFMDSDCNMAPDAVENAVKIFQSDNSIGAVTAHGRVRDAANGDALRKLQDVWYDGQYRIIKGMESSFSSITCCSGALTAFRRTAVQQYMHAWAHDRFLGMEFKFATDRRLTAYILGATPKSAHTAVKSPILQTGLDDIDTMKSSADPDSDSRRTGPSYKWKLKYSPHVRVFIGPPESFSSLIRQQIRWRKSFIRSIFATGSVYWRRPFAAALIYYLQMGLKIIRPYIVLHTMILLPLAGDYLSAAFYMASVLFSGMIYGIEFRLRNPGNSQWLYRPIMTLLSTFVLTWLLIYSAITIRKTAWR